MQNKPDSPMDMAEAMRIAQTPAGRQLIGILQQKGGDDLRQAMEKAAAGDYAQAKQTINALLDSPEIKKLLEQLGR